MSYHRDRWQGVGAISAAAPAPRSAPAPMVGGRGRSGLGLSAFTPQVVRRPRSRTRAGLTRLTGTVQPAPVGSPSFTSGGTPVPGIMVPPLVPGSRSPAPAMITMPTVPSYTPSRTSPVPTPYPIPPRVNVDPIRGTVTSSGFGTGTSTDPVVNKLPIVDQFPNEAVAPPRAASPIPKIALAAGGAAILFWLFRH